LQKAYERMRAHLIEQGKPAQGDRGPCFYRMQDGNRTLMCAVGCLISDRFYDRSFEQFTVDNKLVREALANSGWKLSGAELEFFKGAQSFHDRWFMYSQDWVIRKIDDLARSHGLEVPS